MARVLLVGIDPTEVDFSDPGLPPGFDADFIRRGLVQAIADLTAQGHHADQLFIPADASRLDGLARRLASEPVDCVVIGGGVRHPPQNLALFEAVINHAIRAEHSPLIGLVDHPAQAAEAVGRALGQLSA